LHLAEGIVPIVLVVDDSSTDRLMAGRFLQQEPNVTVSFAGDGNEALERIRAEMPDAVVTDLQMPECDGLQLVDAVKREFPRLPIILMTAQGSEEVAAEALRKGAASYVPKRLLATQLRETVSRILSAATSDQLQSRLMHSLVDGHCRFEIQNDPDVFDSLTNHLGEMLRCLPLGDESERLRVGLTVKHALANGHYFGNLELPFDVENLKSPAICELIRERSSSSPYAERLLTVDARISPAQACFEISHEGPGYLPESYAGQMDDICSPKQFAQGFVLMRSIMDEIVVAEGGRSVRLRKLPISDLEILAAE
jgi:CheY-like chemotaxis protein